MHLYDVIYTLSTETSSYSIPHPFDTNNIVISSERLCAEQQRGLLVQDVYTQSSRNGPERQPNKHGIAVRDVLQGSQDAQHLWHTSQPFRLAGDVGLHALS